MAVEYESAICWIIRNRGGAGGEPPVEVKKVSGWTVTRLVADLFRKPVNQVALDIIELYEHARE